MGRTQKSFTNIIVNSFNQILTLILSFISRTIFIQVFGIEYLGLNAIFADILGLLSMMDLGFNVAIIYSFYRPLAEENYDKIAALTRFYKKIYIMIAVSVGVVGVALIPFLPSIVNVETEIPHIIVYYIMSLANVVVSYLCFYRTSILTADQKNYIVVCISMIVNIVRTIAQVVVMIVLKSYILYITVTILFSVINNLLASFRASYYYPFINKKNELDIKEKKEIIRNIKSIFIYKIAATALNATDNILISIIVDTIAVGLYSNYLMIQNKITLMFSLIFTSLTASVGNLIVKEETEKRYKIFQCEQAVSFVICCIVVPCYATLINEFVALWLGKEYELSVFVVYTASLNLYLECVLQPLWSYREATGLYNKTKWIMVLCAVLNIVFSVFLGRIWSIAGILLASSCSRLLTYIWYEPQLLFSQYFNKDVKKYFLQFAFNLVIILFLIACLLIMSKAFYADSWIKWIIKAICSGGICLIVASIAYFHSEGIGLLRNKIEFFLFNK